MNRKDIKTSSDNTHFLFEDKPIFNKKFIVIKQLINEETNFMQ